MFTPVDFKCPKCGKFANIRMEGHSYPILNPVKVSYDYQSKKGAAVRWNSSGMSGGSGSPHMYLFSCGSCGWYLCNEREDEFRYIRSEEDLVEFVLALYEDKELADSCGKVIKDRE